MQVIKKILCVAFLSILAAAVFAVDFGLSVGGGALLGGNFTSSETDPADVSGGNKMVMNVMAYDTKTFDVGAFVFVDATYAELSAAYIAEIGKVTGAAEAAYSPLMSPHPSAGTTVKSDIEEDYLSHVIIVDLLGKYPFALNEKLTVFPALGVGLKFPFAGNDYSDKEYDVTWGVTFKAGGGLDYALTESLFLRCEALFNYQFASDKEATIEKVDYQFKDAGYNLGPQVKIGVAYKIL
jgi:opacity protein-like surface antigen